jgi:cellulose synthase/poly-beta-1,6-N-acetylglucosamine synthase-like glycosyltransferase/spore germination protein YaaH/peptidoglycan/xylan/chitin deacetylase (PgdA/CDA1 family)
MQDRQIFQTASKTRWQSFKWGTRVLFLLIPVAILAIVIAISQMQLPNIPHLQSALSKKALTDTTSFLSKNSLLAKKYKGFRQFIDQKELTNKVPYAGKVPPGFRNITNTTMPAGIRSAFYVAWDPQSFYSLQRNVNKLNLVIPEWMFIDPNADTLYTIADNRALAVMKNAGVNIMPILSNNFKEVFRGDAVHRIITNPAKKARLINDVLTVLKKNNFVGVNVDFEDLQEKTDEAFTLFQKELYEKLHANGLLVSQDVIPFNEDYNYSTLAKYNDYLIVMAYDQNSEDTQPGPIADQKWIEAAVDDATKKVPPSKLILSIAAYGYDWPKNGQATNVTYQQALLNAKTNSSSIDFDNNNYNLNYSYTDDDNVVHKVFFTDAATAFNTLRFATEDQLSGTAIWRLGAEDARIWQFYNKDMSLNAIRSFDFTKFSSIQTADNVDYKGEGEILDILATPEKGNIRPEIDSAAMLIAEENYDSLPFNFVAKKYGWNGSDTIRNKKKLVLTFDDGPDPTWTPKILDVLSEKHVPASFFIVGLNAENNIPLVKRMYREGHEIGDHTFTHPNIAEVGKKRALLEMESTRLLIECITGHSTILFRAPYNADFEPEKYEELMPVALARTKNFLDIGESIDPLDWEPGVVADSIFNRIVARKTELTATNQSGNIILLHDAGGDTRKATLQALPRIIDYFRNQGYTFTTIADLLGKKKEDLMPAVPKGSGYYLIQANAMLAEFGYWAGHILFTLFITFILLSIARILLMAYLVTKERISEYREAAVLPVMDKYPLVSIIVPAYNEEVNAVSSLDNLLKTDYPNFNIIFVDDGSKDSTYEKVSQVFSNHKLVKVFSKPNGGKASALNYGIAQTDAEFVVCIDADTKLKYDAVSKLMNHFFSEDGAETGAVAGNVKVGNEVNMLTKWQSIEYITSQNFDRRAFANLNAITVVPGAIGAFRKQAIEDAGGFTTDTLAEDCDLTIRIIRSGYIVKNENEALAFTEAPEKLKQFIKQRFRWSFGVLQTFWKHKNLLFNGKYGWLGLVAMPNIILFQYIIPAFIPLADFFMIIGLITGNAAKIIPYYIAFMIFDAGIALIAFRMEKERITRLIWLIPQRLIYRWLMWYILLKAVRRAIKGELQNWGVLKRTGRVKDVQAA